MSHIAYLYKTSDNNGAVNGLLINKQVNVLWSINSAAVAAAASLYNIYSKWPQTTQQVCAPFRQQLPQPSETEVKNE